MSYRIIIETQRSGKKHYYVQKKYFWFFWKYLREAKDISMYAYKIGWETLEEARLHIQSDIRSREFRRQNKIIKQEIIEVI